MKNQKNLLIVLTVCFIGNWGMPPADSFGAIRDVTSIVLYETGIRNDIQFKLVDDEYTKKAMRWIAEKYPSKKLPEDIKGQNQLLSRISRDIQLPDTFELLFHFVRDKETDKLYPRDIMSVEKATTLGGKHISQVWLDLDSYEVPVIDFQMNSEGAVEFKRLTGVENKGKRLAIIISNKIRTAPTIEEQIIGGAGQILGDFSPDEAEEFVQMFMNSGAPFRIE